MPDEPKYQHFSRTSTICAYSRRTFFNAIAAAPALGLLRPGTAAAELPEAKITRVRIYRPPYSGRPIDYLPECLDFKNGKAYTNQRLPGLGVTADMKRLIMIGEVTEPGRRNVYKRPDGSLTHW